MCYHLCFHIYIYIYREREREREKERERERWIVYLYGVTVSLRDSMKVCGIMNDIMNLCIIDASFL